MKILLAVLLLMLAASGAGVVLTRTPLRQVVALSVWRSQKLSSVRRRCRCCFWWCWRASGWIAARGRQTGYEPKT
jgi:hypothetical protein